MGKAGTEVSSAERRYDRIAWFYDCMDSPVERMGTSEWRAKLFSRLEGRRILEVGVGTGNNLPYYPPGKDVTGIDVSGRMLDRARKMAARLKGDFTLLKMDAQNMDFPDASFDAAVPPGLRTLRTPCSGERLMKPKQREKVK